MKDKKDNILTILMAIISGLPLAGEFISLINSEINSEIVITTKKIEKTFLIFQRRIVAKIVKRIEAIKDAIIIYFGTDGTPLVVADEYTEKR